MLEGEMSCTLQLSNLGVDAALAISQKSALQSFSIVNLGNNMTFEEILVEHLCHVAKRAVSPHMRMSARRFLTEQQKFSDLGVDAASLQHRPKKCMWQDWQIEKLST